MEQITTTFKLPEDMAAWLSRVAFELDKSKSEIIRTSLLLSIDTILACPSLLNRIQFEDRITIRKK